MSKKELIEDFENWFYLTLLLDFPRNIPRDEITKVFEGFVEELEKIDGRKKALLIKTIEEKIKYLIILTETSSHHLRDVEFSKTIYAGSSRFDSVNNLGTKLPLVNQLLTEAKLREEDLEND